ncbi:hypothetical protein N0V91_006085 [Didymella pomorum]|uniref:Uncharacterized protein n=1 Tax=Didymella pomorum TaxID=749634 RepID=A0A9W8ZD58_9PLEO|nr:hypothetical protein N0V91_006085 [Didymella pomorum]
MPIKAVRMDLDGQIFYWRCAIGNCQQINQPQNTQSNFQFACKGCGAVTGKEVCLLQITLANGREQLEEIRKELWIIRAWWLQVSLEGIV